MKKKEYDNLIYYSICEVLFDEVKKTNFSTLNSLCKTINTNITYGNAFSTEEYKSLANTMSEISFLYGLDDNETVELVNAFFKNEMWTLYGDIVAIFKLQLKNSYQEGCINKK